MMSYGLALLIRLPCFLFISAVLLHAHKVCLGDLPFHIPLALKSFNECLSDSLWHLSRRPANIDDTILVGEHFKDALALLANKILDINFLSLYKYQYIAEGFII